MAGSTSSVTIGEAQRNVEITPTKPIPPPQPSGAYTIDDSVKGSFPVPGTKVLGAQHSGQSLWGKTAKIRVELASGERDTYFLKVVTLGETGRHMCEGEFESLKEIYAVSPKLVPQPYAWGKYAQKDADTEVYFLLTEFRDVGEQLAELVKLANRLADLHLRSVSPTGKFGFHITTCHAKIAQAVDSWEGSCDGQRTDEAFVFDVCSFYGHNEYDTGNWRAPRHRLSHMDYIRNYKLRFAPSEPVEDWDARNLLYSLTFNIGNTIYIPGSTQRVVVYEDMITLCKMFFPEDLEQKLQALSDKSTSVERKDDTEEEQATAGAEAPEEEEEEEEEGFDWK